MKSVSGKVVFITGGAGEIGLAMVTKLLLNGAKGIAIVDISEKSGLKAINKITKTFGENKAIFVKADITIKRELEDAFETTIRTFKQLDIVINNAGILNETEWKKTISVNLIAAIETTYLAMQKYLPQFKSAEEGVIINVASALGLRAWEPVPVYCSTKHGLVGLGQALGGKEWYQKYKVRILTICPSLVRTQMFRIEPQDEKLFFSQRAAEMMAQDPEGQTVEHVGEALIEIVRSGKSGSLWVVESEEPVYEVVVPHPKLMKKC